MKKKHKVIATFIICLGFFFIIYKNHAATEVSVDVTNQAKSGSDITANNLGDLRRAQIELISQTSAEIESTELAAINEQTTKIDEAKEKEESIKTIEIAGAETESKDMKEDIKAETQVKDMSDEAEIVTLSMTEPVVEFDKVIPKVNEFLNIRTEAASEAEVVGKLYKNSYGIILERGKEWTKIKSGSVTGYANNEYLYFDDEAITNAKSLEAFQVEITAGSVNVRTKPTTESEVIEKAKKGDTFIHVPEMDEKEWVAILYEEGIIGYVSQELADTKFALKTAVSKEEEEKAKKAAELEKALQEAKKHKPKETNRKAVKVSDEELYLLATVVAMEALSEPYEGKLAVANVVVNRMLDGYWGDSISDVVYAKGQFSGANSGRVEKFESKVTDSCKKAAVEALAGNNNIGNYMYFIMKNRASYSSYKKYYILGNHCFYSRS